MYSRLHLWGIGFLWLESCGCVLILCLIVLCVNFVSHFWYQLVHFPEPSQQRFVPHAYTPRVVIVRHFLHLSVELSALYSRRAHTQPELEVAQKVNSE